MYLNVKECFLNKLSLKFFLLSLFCVIVVNKGTAQGDLVIFPKRIVFEEKNRTQQINLANTGKDTAVYNMSFVEYRMTETGSFEEISEPDLGQQFATPFLRVYPRQVTLAPNESQTVKVQLVNISKLEVGEYRSHLYFRAIKSTKPLGKEQGKEKSSGLSVKIEAVFGVSIANIIRKGASDTSVAISGMQYENKSDSESFLHFDINRVGNMSVYGDLKVIYTTTKNKSYEVSNVKGVGVYTPGILRKNTLALQKPKDINFEGGKFKVIYTENEGKGIIAEKELDL